MSSSTQGERVGKVKAPAYRDVYSHYSRNNHPLSFLFCEPSHPFSKVDRISDTILMAVMLIGFAAQAALLANVLWLALESSNEFRCGMTYTKIDPYTLRQKTITVPPCKYTRESVMPVLQWLLPWIFVTKLGGFCAVLQSHESMGQAVSWCLQVIHKEVSNLDLPLGSTVH